MRYLFNKVLGIPKKNKAALTYPYTVTYNFSAPIAICMKKCLCIHEHTDVCVKVCDYLCRDTQKVIVHMEKKQMF